MYIEAICVLIYFWLNGEAHGSQFSETWMTSIATSRYCFIWLA